ncbi:hypothetical protein CEXT_318711 [Caerostris extrusa]|uniref:Uncharacterized protein n=1 Tax=Caerostris extrusa TaxID=172846 RepID=A0AAV4QJP4_CAEEX|nr:hypothetical protein CEXT_318711 [Caerostris extrusa]
MCSRRGIDFGRDLEGRYSAKSGGPGVAEDLCAADPSRGLTHRSSFGKRTEKRLPKVGKEHLLGQKKRALATIDGDGFSTSKLAG